MPTTPRRRIVWKLLGPVIAGGALAIGGLLLWIHAVELRQWEEMERTLRALGDEADARTQERPPLRGEALPGSAWEDYDQALKSMKEVGSIRAFSDFLGPRPGVDRVQILELLRKQAPTLESVRRGARRATGWRKVDWESPSGPNTMLVQYLVQLIVSQARVWTQEGRHADAAWLLLDGARLAADAGRQSNLIGAMVSGSSQALVLDELKGLVQAATLSPGQFGEIARQLDLLDRSFPDYGQSLVHGAIGTGWDMRRAGSVGAYLKSFESLYPRGMPRVSAWRVAFSDRMMLKDAFEKELEWARRIGRADVETWAEASRAFREVDEERAASPNPIPRIVGKFLTPDGYGMLMATFRERRAQIRLLRVAAHFRASGEVLESEDPFGGKLIQKVKEGRLRIWSMGRNGANDGGSGDWNPRTGKDIVLEVTR